MNILTKFIGFIISLFFREKEGRKLVAGYILETEKWWEPPYKDKIKTTKNNKHVSRVYQSRFRRDHRKKYLCTTIMIRNISKDIKEECK